MNKPTFFFRRSRWIRSAQLIIFLGILIGTTSCGLPFQQSGSSEPTPAIPVNTIPTIFVPTPDCGSSTLVIGSITFQIQTIQPTADGTFIVPPDTEDVAYWVEGTNSNYVFLLSPTARNQILRTAITTGDLAAIFWTDCTVASFAVSGTEAGQLNDPALLDQSEAGISIFIQTDPSAAGIVIRGKAPEETISKLDTPQPDESGVLAEISLLDTLVSSDGANINISVSIRNYGQTAFTVSGNHVSLTPENSATLEMISSDPRLPEKIGAGDTKTFTFTFPRPTTPTALLKVFTVEYDVDGY